MAVTISRIEYPKLEGFRLRQFYVSSIADTDTLVTGIPNIQSVAVRTGVGNAAASIATKASGSDSTTSFSWAGSLATSRRAGVHLTDASNGTVTFNAPATATCILMVWSRG